MDIRSKGYSPWPGPLVTKGVIWAPIFRHGVGEVFRRRFAKLLFAMAAFPFLIFLVGIYVRSKPELKMLGHFVRQLQSDATLFHAYYTNGFLVFWLMILAIFSGAGLISHDLKFHALGLYFARPLRRGDYLAGKFSVILFYLLLFTLLPGLLLLVFNALFQGAWTATPGLLLGVLLHPLITGFFLASLTLGLSIISPNTKLVQVVIFFIFIFSDSLAQILHEIFRSDWFYLLSIGKNISQLGKLLFGLPPDFRVSPWMSLLTLVTLGLLALAALSRRVRRAEAQS